jgi:NADH-quinone oxidoreductase subunit E
MFGEESVVDYLCRTLEVRVAETTKDGMFTVLPTGCIGFCDQAPAMLINGTAYGSLNPERIDRILDKLRKDHKKLVSDR